VLSPQPSQLAVLWLLLQQMLQLHPSLQLQPLRQELSSSLVLALRTLIALPAAVVSTLESVPDQSLPRREMEDAVVETQLLMMMLLRNSLVPSVVPVDGTTRLPVFGIFLTTSSQHPFNSNWRVMV
jgi:hypothetical protein